MKYLSAAMALLGLMGCLSATAYAKNCNVENALNSRPHLSTFYLALINTGVADELDEKREYTIFAPTNAAFASLEPSVYPCFYSVQCRADVAAVLRNHILPFNESINSLSKWGGYHIPTIGTRSIYVDEPYKNDYTVEKHRVLTRGMGDQVSIYIIDGIIASDKELAVFRAQPQAHSAGPVMQRTITPQQTTILTPPPSSSYLDPGEYPSSITTYTESDVF